jgi:acyl transferase domain-containing protein
MAESNTSSPKATIPEPIAVLGYSLELPQGIDSGQKLFEAVKEKKQMATHRDDCQYPLPSLHDAGTGSAWKYRVLRGNYFDWERGEFLTSFCNFSVSDGRVA